jgi:hypothetical protein
LGLGIVVAQAQPATSSDDQRVLDALHNAEKARQQPKAKKAKHAPGPAAPAAPATPEMPATPPATSATSDAENAQALQALRQAEGGSGAPQPAAPMTRAAPETAVTPAAPPTQAPAVAINPAPVATSQTDNAALDALRQAEKAPASPAPETPAPAAPATAATPAPAAPVGFAPNPESDAQSLQALRQAEQGQVPPPQNSETAAEEKALADRAAQDAAALQQQQAAQRSAAAATQQSAENGTAQAALDRQKAQDQVAQRLQKLQQDIKSQPASVAVPATAPAAPEATSGISLSKEQRLADLLQRYRADQITPLEYHTERAKIIAEP